MFVFLCGVSESEKDAISVLAWKKKIVFLCGVSDREKEYVFMINMLFDLLKSYFQMISRPIWRMENCKDANFHSNFL